MPPLACGLSPMRRLPLGASSRSSGSQLAFAREQLLGSIAAHPLLRAAADAPASRRAATAAPDASASCLRRAMPSTSRGPVQPFGVCSTSIGQRGRCVKAVAARVRLDLANARRRCGRACCAIARCVASWLACVVDVERLVAVAAEQLRQLFARNARQHRRARDLVAVEMQDRQHRAIARRIEKLVRVPAGRERSGLRFAVADDAGDDQIRIVERGAVRVRQRVAELAAFVDRARRFRRDVAGNAAGKRELLEQPPQPVRCLPTRSGSTRCTCLRDKCSRPAPGRRARARRCRSCPGRTC